MIFKEKSWYRLTLFYLLTTALLGVFLRILQNWSFDIKFTNILHAHSHTALLGWCSMAFFILLVNAFVVETPKSRLRYHRLFYAFQFSVIGMLVFFPFQGYSPTTIFFSSAFIIVSYVFSYHFIKDTKVRGKHSIATKFAHYSVFFLLISSLGPWSLGPLNAMGKGGSDFYFNMIYFYLHFLYNGWFLFAILALCFSYLEKHDISFNKSKSERILVFLVVSTLLAYTLSTLWIEPHFLVYLIGMIAMFLQLIAFGYLVEIIRNLDLKKLFKMQLIRRVSFGILIAFLIKVLLQTLSTIPSVAFEIAMRREWVLAYLHLIFLGIVTPFILLQFNKDCKGSSINTIKKWGGLIFLIGFVLNEVLMFVKGLEGNIAKLNTFLLIAAFALLIGVALLFIGFQIDRENNYQP